MKVHSTTPILGFAAHSGTGKTTLLVNLIPRLKEHGLRTAVIKHAHHSFEIDHKGKDSYKIRQSGASQMLIGSRQRWALMVEFEEDNAADNLIQHFVDRLDHSNLDLILVEGFKPQAIPKIELHRPSLKLPLLYQQGDSIIAIATDEPLADCPLPQLELNNYDQIVNFIIDNICQPHSLAVDTHP